MNIHRLFIRRAMCFLLCILTLSASILLTAPRLAAITDEKTPVKVGFFAFDGYHMQTTDSENRIIRSGYGYEILQHLAGYCGFDFEYVGYENSWNEMQTMLENGEIDILTSAQKTPQREEKFDFTETNIGISSAILTVREGDSVYINSDYANWSGIRVGMIEGNSRNESFAEYAEEHGFTYESVYYNDTDEMVAELKSNKPDRKIDAVITSNLRQTDGEWVLAQFDASPFYIMVKKGNKELLNRIDDAIAAMDINEPGLRTRLMNKYYNSGSGMIIYTVEEKKFIEEMKGHEFTALINPDRAPFSYYEDDEIKGIAYEAAQMIISRSGLNVKFLDIKDAKEYYSAVDGGEVDIRFEIANSYSEAERIGCWLTSPFITVSMAKLYINGTTSIKTAAEPENRDIADDYVALMRSFGLEPVFYSGIKETVNAVINGECDMSYMAIDTATMEIKNDVRNRLVCEEAYGMETSYAVAVQNDNNPLLFSIINKAAASVSEAEINDIRRKYSAELESEFSIIAYFYDYPLHVILFISTFLLIIIMIVGLISLDKRRKTERKYLAKEQMQNSVLKDALDAAERAGIAKSQFLSLVSHEMRTPLNAIIGFIELAKDSDREQMSSYLASSEIASKQLLNVINDVLDMSSIESGKMKIANMPFNFKHLISSVTNIYGTQCKQKNISYETKIQSPIDDWLIGDELRLNQILMNLLGNSVKFTSSGSITLSVSQTAINESLHSSIKDSKVFLRFEISDTGCGISDEMKERLFKPFEQENATTAKKYGGSGLGLSIVKNLTSMMGGSVSVESEVGRGTKFTIDLPFGICELADEAGFPEHISKLRILVVDDEESERVYISQILTRMNVRHTCVNGGLEALDELKESEEGNDIYNVCLVDWRMPAMDGFDTTSKIRAIYGDDVVVIIVSAYDFEQAAEIASKAGANMFLSKPIFQSSLYNLLMTLTDGKIAEQKQDSSVWDFAGRRVLLAEDNILNQIVAKGYLSKYNIVVDVACDGMAATEMFSASEPGYYDAILMDIQMPVMDGFTATKTIRQSRHPEAKTIQIIAQTADAFDEDISKAISAGMNAYVVKPIKPELLAKALYDAFAMKSRTAHSDNTDISDI